LATRGRPSDAFTYQDLAAHLQRGEPLPVYAIVGDEPFARSQALGAIRRAVLKEASPDLALSQYGGSEAPEPAQLFDELRTPPFLAPRRLVIIEDAAPFVERARDALVNYLARPSTVGTLVLTLDKLAKNEKLYKAIASVGAVVACEAPREYELPGWIAARVRAHGKRMDGAAVRRLAECVGVNLPILDQSLLKLTLYVGPREAITEADVDALVEDLPVTTVFKLTDAVGTRDAAKALRVLDNLLAQNAEPPYIVSMIRWALERLINARTLLDAGATPDAISKALHMGPGYFLEQTLTQARRRSRPELQRAFALLLQADLDTKSSLMAPRDVLEHLLLKLCA
jgi:DNA polymerase-3 subunit delta